MQNYVIDYTLCMKNAIVLYQVPGSNTELYLRRVDQCQVSQSQALNLEFVEKYVTMLTRGRVFLVICCNEIQDHALMPTYVRSRSSTTLSDGVSHGKPSSMRMIMILTTSLTNRSGTSPSRQVASLNNSQRTGTDPFLFMR